LQQCLRGQRKRLLRQGLRRYEGTWFRCSPVKFEGDALHKSRGSSW
jgi:hypothetical protein